VNNWKVIFATVIIFGAGVITGGLLVEAVQKTHPPNSQHKQSFHPSNTNANIRVVEASRARVPEILRGEFLERLNKAVQLSSEQHDAIGKIIFEAQERNRVIWATNNVQIRKVAQETRQQIRNQLQPKQQQLFENLLKQRPSQRLGTNAAVP
jgi:hypothetical protein